jgi:hypothetical protein
VPRLLRPPKTRSGRPTDGNVPDPAVRPGIPERHGPGQCVLGGKPMTPERIIHFKNLANVHDIVEYKVEITQGELREFLAAIDEVARLRGESPIEATMPETHVPEGYGG